MMYMKRLRACTNQAQMRSHATDPRKSNSELYRTLHLESTTRNIHCVLTQRRKEVLRDFLHELRKLPWGQQKRQEHFFFSFPPPPHFDALESTRHFLKRSLHPYQHNVSLLYWLAFRPACPPRRTACQRGACLLRQQLRFLSRLPHGK